MSKANIIGRGVDTLVLNVCYTDSQLLPVKQELAEDLQNELNVLQDAARLNEAPVCTRWTFKGVHLFMQEKGSRGQWRWILKSPLLAVAISRGRLSRIIAQVRLSSEYLWSCEYLAEAIVEVGFFLYGMFGDYLWFQISEVDLCADVVGWDISQANWQECFISRAIGDDGRPRDDSLLIDGPDVVRRRWKRIETLDFGKHTSAVSCCIYHKTAEIRQKSPTKVWFYDLWKRNGWDGEAEVWRVEFRLTREFLHAVSIEAAEDLPEHIQALWEYCAGRPGGAADGLPDGWLRYVTPTKDSNSARWPVHPAWTTIQGAFLQEDDGLGPIVRVRKREKNIERGLASVIGYLSTLAAWVGGDLATPETDISLVLRWLYGADLDYLEEKDRDFSIRDYRKVTGRFAAWLQAEHGITDTDAITLTHLRSWVNYLQKTPLKSDGSVLGDSTVYNYSLVTQVFCHWLEEEGVIDPPITTRFKLPRLTEKFIPTFTHDDVEKLLEACEEGDRDKPRLRKALTARNRAIVSVLIDTGIRRQELVGLRLCDIDRRMMVLTVRRKGGKWQQVPISREGFKALHEYLKKHRSYLAASTGETIARKEDRVFLADDGKPLTISGVSKLFGRLQKRTGIEGKRVSPHNCRRYMATMQLAMGRSEIDVMRQMGHTTLNMTKRYASLTIDHLRRSHEKYSPLRAKRMMEEFRESGGEYWDEE